MRQRSMSLPTARKVLNGASSGALDRTSSRALAASGRRTARPILSGRSTLTTTLLEHEVADEIVLTVQAAGAEPAVDRCCSQVVDTGERVE
jgi:hypothetical protein